MNFTDAVKTCFKKYFTFSGRAARSEFWWWVLFIYAAGVILSLIDYGLFGIPFRGLLQISFYLDFSSISNVFSILVFIPSIAVSMRRLHDTNRTGLWLLGWIPAIALAFVVVALGVILLLVGAVALLIWYCLPGTPGTNKYGPDPLGGPANDVSVFE